MRPEILTRLFGCALVPVVLSTVLYIIKRKTKFSKLPYAAQQIIIGVIFGFAAIFGTGFGVDVGGATANARDAAPLCAGLFFGSPAGIIAGIIGGVHRWFAAEWAGMYSRFACSFSTIFAGFYAAFLRRFIFDGKRPAWSVAFITGGVMEIIHMLVLFLTHLTDSAKAFEIVKLVVGPMVLCNGFSVFASAFAITVISTGIHKKETRYNNISQQFQIPMLISVVLAFLTSTAFVWMLQTYSAKESAVKLLSNNINDVRQEIKAASDKHLLEITRLVAKEYEVEPTSDLKVLAEKHGVRDIWIVNSEGIITDATDENVGFDMTLDADKPVEEQQSNRFMVLATGEASEYVQEYMPLASDSKIERKMAGVALRIGGFVQTAYDADMFQDEISKQVKDITKNRHIGESGHIIIADEKYNIVSDVNGTECANGNFIRDIKAEDGESFTIELNEEKCLCVKSRVEGFYVIAVMPESEMYTTRDSVVYVNSFMEILVFAMLFILIYLVIRKIVVNNLHKVNDSLSKIIEGDLDTVVDVHSNEEFASLSDDINSTVTTLKRYISEAEARIDKELEFAKNIQHAALPSVFPPYPERKDFDIYALMDTAKEVGGDFYDFYMLDSSHIAILIADVSGKGIPAAMFMMRAKTLIKSLAETGLSVNEIFTQANSKLCEGNDADMFVTAWMGIVNTETGHVDFVNAGHNPPLIYRKGGGYEYLKSRTGLVLAGMDGMIYKKQEFELNPGDRIVLYTDGVTEATDKEDKLYGEDRLADFLTANSQLDVTEALTAVKADVDRFAGEREQFDDITMMAFDYMGNEPEKVIITKQFDASDDSLAAASEFVVSFFEERNASPKTVMQTGVAFEEVFVNVAHYAYKGEAGKVEVSLEDEGENAVITLKDSGIPFNPLEREEPDITISAEERNVGGLGIFITKKVMDEVSYEYKEGFNILTMRKKYG